MCDVCSKKYKSAHSLKNHKRHAHEKTKSLIPCSHCDMKFGNRGLLNAHMSYVTGKMPFQCRLCDQEYLYFNGLKWHFEHHHIGELLLECRPCDFRTNSRFAIKAHQSSLEHLQLVKSSDEVKPQLAGEPKGKVVRLPEVFKCQCCEYSNTNLACVKRHYSIKHVAKARQKC